MKIFVPRQISIFGDDHHFLPQTVDDDFKIRGLGVNVLPDTSDFRDQRGNENQTSNYGDKTEKNGAS